MKETLSTNSVGYVPRCTCAAAVYFILALAGQAQNHPIGVIAFGAHPDDCDLGAGGLAAKYAAQGDKVKPVSLTNGDAGHHRFVERNSPIEGVRQGGAATRSRDQSICRGCLLGINETATVPKFLSHLGVHARNGEH